MPHGDRVTSRAADNSQVPQGMGVPSAVTADEKQNAERITQTASNHPQHAGSRRAGKEHDGGYPAEQDVRYCGRCLDAILGDDL